MRLVLVLSIVTLLIAPGAVALTPLPPLASTPANSASAQPGDEPQVTDSAGDAHMNSSSSASQAVTNACGLANESTRRTCTSTVPAAPVGGVAPGPDGLDILSAKLTETRATIDVTLTLVSLDAATFGGAVNETKQATYTVCWTTADGACTQAAELWVALDAEGKPNAQHSFSWDTESCAAGWDWCQWVVPGTVTFGSPGSIAWQVPRDLVQNASKGNILREPTAMTRQFDYSARSSYQVSEAGLERRGFLLKSEAVIVDTAGPGKAVALTLDAVVPASQNGDGFTNHGQLYGPAHDPHAVPVSGRLIETPANFTASLEYQTVDATPTNLWFDYYFTMPNGLGVYAYANFDGGSTNARAWTSAHKDGPYFDAEIPASVQFSPGSPGWVNITLARSDLGTPRAGEMLRLFASDSSTYTQTDAKAVGSGVESAGTIAWFGYAPPWRFTMDTAATPVTATRHLRDPAGDASFPVGVPGSASTFDITGVDVKGVSPTETKFTLQLADLSSITVPKGYKAVLYAVGIQTDDGGFMAAYYKDDTKQEWLCSQDVDVLSQIKRDPNEVVWAKITGIVSLSTQNGGTGTATASHAGAISLIVPHSCFAVEKSGPFTAKRVSAGTYLIGTGTPATSAVQVLDEVPPANDVILGAAAPVPLSPPWWVAPFGFDGFWNILALTATGTGGLIAVFARQRRRNTLQRELRAVEEVHAAQRADPPAWTRAMNTRRAHGADLLRRNRLRPDELLVVERRIELLGADLVPLATARAPTVAAAGAMLLDRYHIDRLLGEGAQGRAFLARDTKLNREVVVKVLSTIGMDARAKRLLIAEARLAAGIDHLNVVRVFDVQETDTEALLILEYVDGGSLRGLMERHGKLPRREALRIFRGVLAGLQAAHDRGIVHRDVKPENVLISKDGQPKLADFGAAREARADATIVAGATGTLAYMSPEQVRGLTADARSDLYAAAALLYEMLSGDAYLPVGRVDEYQLRSMILERAPELRLPQDSMSLTPVLLRALAKVAAERYPTAPELMGALDRATME